MEIMRPMGVKKVIGFKERKPFNEVFKKDFNVNYNDTTASNREFEKLDKFKINNLLR